MAFYFHLLLLILIQFMVSKAGEELFVYESDWFKKIEAPVLDNAKSLYSYCLNEAPDSEIYSKKPLFLLVFTPDS